MSENENLRQMVKDSLLMICRQGVECEQRFAIHAVIGVTVDDDQSFYVHIDESVEYGDREPSVPSGGRRTRTSGRKRTSRDSIDGHSSPKKIMLSEWVKGKAGESPQVQQWTVVKVKPEQQDEEDLEEDSNAAMLTFKKDGGPQSKAQKNVRHITCVYDEDEPTEPVTRRKSTATTTPRKAKKNQHKDETPEMIEKRKRKAAHSRAYRARLKEDKEKWEAYKSRARQGRNRKGRQINKVVKQEVEEVEDEEEEEEEVEDEVEQEEDEEVEKEEFQHDNSLSPEATLHENSASAGLDLGLSMQEMDKINNDIKDVRQQSSTD